MESLVLEVALASVEAWVGVALVARLVAQPAGELFAALALEGTPHHRPLIRRAVTIVGAWLRGAWVVSTPETEGTHLVIFLP